MLPRRRSYGVGECYPPSSLRRRVTLPAEVMRTASAFWAQLQCQMLAGAVKRMSGGRRQAGRTE